MKLSDHDLQQLNADWLRARTPEELLYVSQKLLDDLKEARERLNQNSTNSSVPSGSQPPWFHPAEDTENEDDDDIPIPPPPDDKDDSGESSTDKTDAPSDKAPKESKPPKTRRNPGKQPGAQGFGHTQILPVTATEHHQACQCTGCGKEFTSDTPSRAYTGFYTVDIEYEEPDKPGIRVTNTLHRYYDTTCECGHTTRIAPHREPPEALFDGIELSTGTIDQCIHESGRSVAPVEDQLIEELLASDLLHADETTWLIAGKPFWLWVFVTTTVTLYSITFRTNELVRNLLSEFTGWLMSDGYHVYREITKRLRCWAHLVRKAKGLAESLDREAAAFGKRALEVLKTLMDAVYQAREGPPGINLEEEYWALLESFSAECERMLDSKHEKARALAVEFLNDWEAIFMVLRYPHLPLTNNEAERALRHWVIIRKISHGTRSDEGTRVFALLASVIDTCRQRDVSPWRYLEQVIRERRAGRNAPPLPHGSVAGV